MIGNGQNLVLSSRNIFFTCVILVPGTYMVLLWKYSPLDSKSWTDKPRMIPKFPNLPLMYTENETYIIDTPVKTRPIKYILFWTTAFGAKDFNFGFGQSPFSREQCPTRNCYTTDNRSLVENFDALVFHSQDFNSLDLPIRRNEKELYVFYAMESVTNTLEKFRPVPNNLFNISVTYRYDSDIVAPYGRISKKNTDSIDSSFINDNFKNKTKLCAWFVSNCNTASKRELLVAELSSFMKIDVFGDCSKQKCPKNDNAACNEMLRSYKFYLAFENSLCPDYVTEKFYRSLQYGVIPVVYGGADYFKIAPPHSYINARDFKSVKELAEYLLLVSKNNFLYNEYFEWKRNYIIGTNKKGVNAFCQLCSMLHSESFLRTYDDFRHWWLKEKKCENSLTVLRDLV